MKRKQKSFINDIVVKTIPENYTKIPNEVLRNSNLSFKAKGILGLILSNKKGWKNHLHTIASMGKEGKDATNTGIKELEENGHLIKFHYRNKKTKNMIGSFWVCVPLPFIYQSIDNEKAEIEKNGAEIIPSELENYKSWQNPKPGNPILEKPETGKPGSGNPEPGYPNLGNPLLKRKDIKKENRKKEIFFALFKLFPIEWRKDSKFRQLIKDFVRHRIEIKSKFEPTTIEYTYKKLIKYDIETAKAAIEKSIENGWTGVFPDKINFNGVSPNESSFDPDKFLQDKFGGLTPRYNRFKKRAHDPVMAFFSKSNTQVRGQVIRSLYGLFSTFEQKQHRKDTDFWLEVMPDGIEIIEEYCKWIENQTWLTNITPNLFTWTSQVFQRFLKDYENDLGHDLFTGRSLY